MVKCTNGLKEFEVTRGAFETFFKPNGYTIIKGAKSEQADLQELQDESGESTDADIINNNELIEKPIAQWTKEEVKDFAKAYSIDISKTRNVAQAKELIKGYIDSMNQ